jgi:GxxExxY protein
MLRQQFINQLSYEIVGCAIEIHKQSGPGLLESVYESCMTEELKLHERKVLRQLPVPIKYEDINLGTNLVLDLLIKDLIIVELKAVEVFISIYIAQLLSFLKLACKSKGLLINFNTENITQSK